MFYSQHSRRQTEGCSATCCVRRRKWAIREGDISEAWSWVKVKCTVLTVIPCKQRHTCPSASVSACWGEVSAVASPNPVYTVTKQKERSPENVFKENLTLCNHSCLGFDLREGREKIITCFWVPFYNEWKAMLDLNRMVMGGCLCECDGEVLNATWGK